MAQNYTYGDGNWKDKLTNYNGQAISYDAIGNPTKYRGMDMSWQGGRQLAAVIIRNNPNTTLSFEYNEAGLRTEKKVNNVKHTYYWANGKLSAEICEGSYSLFFHYDANGDILGFSYKVGETATEYYYIKNLQGDVLKVINSSGDVVAEYSYDAWGRILTSSGAMADINPIRYRGYYYDTELGLYYLQSRYYDPEVGRFINADAYVSTGQGLLGCNMFAYCGNNPITFNDRSGQSFSFIIGYNMNFFGWGATFSWSFVSTEENWGVQFSYYISEDSDLAELNNQTIGVDTGLYIGVQYTEKNNMDEMTGLSKTTGGDVLLGFDFITDASGEYVGWQFGASTCSFNAHSYYTNTETVFKLPTFNLFKLAKDWIAKEN